MGLKIGVEIGVDYGDYSHILLRYSNLDKLYQVDQWYGKWLHRKPFAVDKMKLHAERSCIMHEKSMVAVNKFPDRYFDFIYIDASHRHPDIDDDLREWIPKLRIGGVFAGHDYVVARKCDVIPAVDAFMKDRPEKLHITTADNLPSWFFIKEQ